MTIHDDARELIERTRPAPLGPRAVQLVQSVAWHETRYGTGWRRCPALVRAHNWGAIHALAGETGGVCDDADAHGVRYVQRFRSYPSDEAGVRDLWRVMWRAPGIRRVLWDDAIDTRGLARAMRRARYYEAPETSYASALARAVDTIRASR